MTQAEAVQVIDGLIGEHVPKTKRRNYVPHRGRILQMLCRLIPTRIEHEVNKLRGWDFDATRGKAGDALFTYERMGEA